MPMVEVSQLPFIRLPQKTRALTKVWVNQAMLTQQGVRIWLPKENINEAWAKAKKMIDIYLGTEKHKEEG
jgi:hypothetical protein